MIKSFGDQATQDIYNGINSKKARQLPVELQRKARRLLDQINAARQLKDLNAPPGNQLEDLKGELKGFHSVRINNQWRVIFMWNKGNASKVKIVDYHR